MPGRSLTSGAALAFAASSLFAGASGGTAPISWQPVGPPGNPAVTALATAQRGFIAPNPVGPTLFAAAAGAVFRSNDDGGTWTPTGSGLEGHGIASLAVRQTTGVDVDVIHFQTAVFAGTVDAGIYRLSEGSSLWTQASTGLSSLSVRALAVGGRGVVTGDNPALVYAGTLGGLFASSDGGDTWQRKVAGLPSGIDSSINTLAVDPSSPSTLYAGGVGLFKSVNGGETWTELKTGVVGRLSIIAVAVDPRNPSHLYVSANIPCVEVCPAANLPLLATFRSQDGGLTWSPMVLNGYVLAFAATPSWPSRVFAGTTGVGVLESLDEGATWEASNSGLGIASVSSFVIDPLLPSLLFAGTVNGVFRAGLGQVSPPCAPNAVKVCLGDRRFSIDAVFRVAGGDVAFGQALPITDVTGAFWFFDAENLELVVKVLDGRSVNGKYWVFYGSLTNVEFTLIVTDTLTGAVKTYFNPQGQLASVADTGAF